MPSWYCVECGFENLDMNAGSCELCQCDRVQRVGGEGEPLLENKNEDALMEAVPPTPESFGETGQKTPEHRAKKEAVEPSPEPVWHDAKEKANDEDDDELIVLRKSSPSRNRQQAETEATVPLSQKNKRGAGEALVSASPKTKKTNGSKSGLTEKENYAPSERISPVKRTIVASFTVASEQGRRKTMEDVYMVNGSIQDEPSKSYFAVFDGHAGSRAAEYCGQRMLDNITSTASWRRGNIIEAVKYGMQRTEQAYLRAALTAAPKWFDGTTAVACVIVNEIATLGWVGDSRAVLGKYDPQRNWHAQSLTLDHKPTSPAERDRITTCGGSVGRSVKEANATNVTAVAGARCPVFCFGAHPAAPMRCYPGGLSLSRSIGDVTLKYHSIKCVIGDPEVYQHPIDLSTDRFIILGCDGIWDVLSNEQAVNIVANAHNKKIDAAKALVKAASNAGSTDNMTAVVVKLVNS